MNRSSFIEHLEGRRQFSAATGLESGFAAEVATASGSDSHLADRLPALTVPTSVRPAVTAVQMNDGDPQRSMVNSLTVTFDRAVVLSNGAITVAGRNGAGAGTGVNVANPSGDKQKFVLTFSGTPVVGGSLADGVYDLTVAASKVHAGTAGGVTMTANFTLAFHRLFGDVQGDAAVNVQDYVGFRPTFGRSSGEAGYKWYFDYNADGVVNSLDYSHFRRAFGASLTY
jgi:hypothetical protein